MPYINPMRAQVMEIFFYIFLKGQTPYNKLGGG